MFFKKELPDMLEEILPAVVQIVTATGQGTGFVVQENGLIVTNRHVVGYNPFVEVKTNEDKKYYGQLIASNPHIDTALLYVNKDFSRTLKLVDSSSTRLGEPVVAIGHPYNYNYSVHQGIISSIGRKDVGPLFKNVKFLQLDMGINPGNSGGPLIRRKTGEVIGMITLGLFQGDNIGFAMPSNYTDEFIKETEAKNKEKALSSIYCSVCGYMNENKTTYCNRCGSKIQKIQLKEFVDSLPKKESTNVMQVSDNNESGKIKCPSCKTVNDSKRRYCENCGTTLQ
jgi:serine protease Do